MAISTAGIGSGLDVDTLVSKLMAVETQPLARLSKKEASYQSQLSALGSIKSTLATLQSSAQALSDPSKFLALKATASDSTLYSTSVSSSAVAGGYSVEVQTLAQAHKLKSQALADTATVVGSGTITVQFGTYSGGSFTLNPEKSAKTITIGAGQNTLGGVRDAINAADAGVTASIVNDGTGNRLVISSKDGGVANAMRIAVADSDGNHTDNTGLSQLAYDASTGGTVNLTETMAAQNATLRIDGMLVSKSSNTVTDAIQGVTLNLTKASPGTTTTLTVARDSASVKSTIDGFVKAYNDASKMLRDASAYNATTKSGAVFQGDATVRDIQNQLRTVLNNALTSPSGGLTRLSDIGITFQKDGSLALDSAKLQKVIDDPSKNIASLFAAVGKPTDSLVSFGAAGSATKPGTYDINITQPATQGKLVGGIALGGTTVITAGVNDTLEVEIDGRGASIKLGAGNYTPDQLAAELQSKINGSSALISVGSKVTVGQDAGVLSITSSRYGVDSIVKVTSSNALADLLGTPDTSNAIGKDVAGTIGNGLATGAGQLLTATSGDANGLRLNVAGATGGNRGSITFNQGFAFQLSQMLTDMLSTTGAIASRTEGINRSVKDLENQATALNTRLELVEKRYRAQFTALDGMIASMTQTSSFLSQQLANLPGSSS
jgi:flagellar hook-associated protein 2